MVLDHHGLAQQKSLPLNKIEELTNPLFTHRETGYQIRYQVHRYDNYPEWDHYSLYLTNPQGRTIRYLFNQHNNLKKAFNTLRCLPNRKKLVENSFRYYELPHEKRRQAQHEISKLAHSHTHKYRKQTLLENYNKHHLGDINYIRDLDAEKPTIDFTITLRDAEELMQPHGAVADALKLVACPCDKLKNLTTQEKLGMGWSQSNHLEHIDKPYISSYRTKIDHPLDYKELSTIGRNHPEINDYLQQDIAQYYQDNKALIDRQIHTKLCQQYRKEFVFTRHGRIQHAAKLYLPGVY